MVQRYLFFREARFICVEKSSISRNLQQSSCENILVSFLTTNRANGYAYNFVLRNTMGLFRHSTGQRSQASNLRVLYRDVEEHHIMKTFKFPNFREALTFVNRVGELAEAQGHHPDISLAWGKVETTSWTHKINGLTESDFILAAKIDKLSQADRV